MGNCLVPKWLFWVVISVLLLHSDKSRGCLEKEKLALLQIKKQFSSLTNDTHHLLLPSWSDESFSGNCCLWERVICHPSSAHIIELSLSSLIDSGDVNRRGSEDSLNMTVFQDLEELQTLDLSNNKIASLVEDEAMCKLRSLQVLSLAWNGIGGIPNCVGNLSFLTELDLYFNNITGNIPSGLCNLKRLQVLDLYGNYFNGSLPKCIGNLNSLRDLSLSYQGYRGSLSDISGLCKLAKLEMLELGGDLSQNNLPSCVGNLTSLRDLSLPVSNLSGTLPPGLCNLKRLQVLNLSGNHLKGSLPKCIGNLNSLRQLYLGYNGFSGSLSGVCKLAKLERLGLDGDYSRNNLPSCVGNLTSLRDLIMGDSNLSGTLPPGVVRNLLFSGQAGINNL